MPYQRWLLDILSDEFRNSKGFRVDYYPGWETRGRVDFEPRYMMEHHTGAGAYNALLRYMAEGPVHPPLCNIANSRPANGIVRVTVVAAGRANHSGMGQYGTIPPNQGNKFSIGNEGQNTGSQPWPNQQLEAQRRCDAAILNYLNRDVSYLIDHKTYAPNRKWDRHSISLPNERRQVDRLLTNDPLESLMSNLNDKQKKNLMTLANLSEEELKVAIDFSKYLVGQHTNGRSFAYQLLNFHREERPKLNEFLDGIEDMGSSPKGQARALSAMWREAGARGWERDPDKFKENRAYTEDDLG